MIKLDNHRRLGDTEKIRKGDFYKNMQTGEVCPVAYSIGRSPYDYYGYEFYRRKHTKMPTPVVTPVRNRTVTVQKVSTKEKKRMPVVEFTYKNTTRVVSVISLNDTNLKGLEHTWNHDGTKYQFKSFLVNRVQGPIVLTSY